MTRLLFCGLSLALLLGGCTVGPDYRRPQTAGAAGQWTEPADTGAIDPAWWRQFGDARLTSLIEQALTRAPDVREAEARLAEARANRDAAAGGRLPGLNATGSAMQNRLSTKGQFPIDKIPAFTRDFSLFDLGFDASWEIDLWGRQRRTVEAAEARLGAAEAARQDVLVQLTAEIARAYLDMRAAQANGLALQGAAEASAEIARLTRLRFEAGEASRGEAETAQGNARAAAAAVPDAKAEAAGAAYRIAALLGASPEAIAPSLLASVAPQPESPDSILVGVRSDLLERRPDIRRAERALAAATAGVGVAKADLFPRFSLIGGIGQQARSVGDLVDEGATRWQVGPGFSWPIFAGGTVRAQVRAAGARADAAAADYEKAVTGALADSAAAINRFVNARDSARDTAAADASAAAALALGQQRATRGEDDRLQLKQAELTRIGAARAAIAARRAKAEAAVALFKALGGAWQAAEPAAPQAAALAPADARR